VGTCRGRSTRSGPEAERGACAGCISITHLTRVRTRGRRAVALGRGRHGRRNVDKISPHSQTQIPPAPHSPSSAIRLVGVSKGLRLYCRYRNPEPNHAL